MRRRVVALQRAGHVNRVLCGLMLDISIQQTGNLQRNPGAHNYSSNSRQHGAIDCRKMRCLNFLQIIDADWIVVPFARQKHFYKIADNIQFNQGARIVFRMARHGLIRSPFTLPARNVVSLPNALCHCRKRKRAQPAMHVPTRIAILQSSRKNLIEGCTGYNAKLSKTRDGIRQAPIRHACAHAALNDEGSWIHRGSILALCTARACLNCVIFSTMVSASTTSLSACLQQTPPGKI